MKKFNKVFILLLLLGISLSGMAQELIYDNQTEYFYQTSKGLTRDSFDIDISNCSSITASFDFEFADAWLGHGNMEYSTECESFGPCDGDPYNPLQEGCVNCWDFLYAEFYIDGQLVYTKLIGGPDADDDDQEGTITLPEACVVDEGNLHIKIWTQTWAAEEWVRFTNVQVLCWGDMPELTVNPDPACQGDDVQITTTTNTDFSPWAWTGPGGYSSALRDPLLQDVDASDAGTYTLIVEDENGCEIIKTIDVTVHPFPDLPDYGPFCTSDPQFFLDGSPSGIAGSWSGPGVLGTIFNPGIAGAGTHTLTFTTWPQSCEGTIEVVIYDEGELIPPVLPQDLCDDDNPIPLPSTISSIDGNWTGSGVSGGEFDPSVAGEGIYTLTFTPINNNCVDPFTVQITVSATPSAYTPAAMDVCDDGNTIDLTDANDEITGGATGLGVNWYQDAGLTNQINTPTAYIPGATTVYATVVNGNCVSAPVALTINLIDDVQIFPIDPISVCGDENGNANINLTLYEPELNGNTGNSVVWYSDPGLMNPIGNTGSYPTSGGTIYAVVANSACTSSPQAVQIIVNTKPVGTPTSMTVCAGSGATVFNLMELEPIIYPGGSDYTWYEDSDTSQLINNPSGYTTTPPTTVYVVFTDVCRSEPVPVVLDVEDEIDLGSLNDITICEGAELLLDGPDIAGMSYEWIGPNGFVAYTRQALVSASADAMHAGVYTLTGTIGECSESQSLTVTVSSSPTVEIEIVQEVSCYGDNDGMITVNYQGDGIPVDYTWSSPVYDGQATLNNLSAGFYSVTVTDDVGCTASANITLTQPDELILFCQLLSGITGPSAEDAQVEISVQGGTSDFFLTWTGAASGNMNIQTEGTYLIPDLPEGTVTFTLVDASGCSAVCTVIIPSVDCDISASIEQTSAILCYGDETGEIIVEVSGASGNITYSWSDGQYDGESHLIGLSAGTYTVTVEDEDACQASANISLSQPSELVFSCSLQSGLSGVGAEDAVAELNIGGGTPEYYLEWEGAVSGSETYATGGTYTILNLPEGSINFILTDENGCISTCSVVVASVDCDISAEIHQTEIILCSGDSSAAIIVEVTGSSGALNYTWSDSQFNGQNELMNLSAGTYAVTVEDAEACIAEAEILIEDGEVIVLTATVVSQPSDPVAEDGVINLTIEGGSGPFDLEYEGPKSGNMQAIDFPVDVENLPAGVYDFHVRDINQCVATTSAVLSPVDCDLTLELNQEELILCHGDETASILAQTNGQGVLQFKWSDNDITEKTNPKNLGAGIYTLTITDSEGCAISESITITEPDELIITCSVQNNESGPGESDATVVVNISGGTMEYKNISWEGPQGSASLHNPEQGDNLIGNLSEGEYSVTVIDANDCQATCTFTIVVDDCTMSLMVMQTEGINCYGDHGAALLVEVNNGTEPYEITWSDGTLNGELNPTGLAAGVYSITVEDAHGCTAINEIEILDAEYFGVTCSVKEKTSEIDAEDGVISLDIEGGTGPFSLSYTGPVSDNLNNVVFPLDIDNLPLGNYTFIVTDADGCVTECEIILNTDGCDLELQLEQGEEILCYGDQTASIISHTNAAPGVLQLSWSHSELDGKANPTGLGAGTYRLTITDEEGCSASAEIEITEPDPLSLVCESIADPDSMEYVRIHISGGTAGYSYLLKGEFGQVGTYNAEGSYIISNLSEGDYSIELTDANGCVTECEFIIRDFRCAIEVNAQVENISCYGQGDGRIELEIDSAYQTYTIVWDNPIYNGMQVIENLEQGVYSVTVTDEADCLDSMSISIYEPAPAIVTIEGADYICTNETIILSALDTFETYIWNGNVGNAEYLLEDAGTVILEAINASGCSAFDTIEVTPADTALLNIVDSLCANEQIVVNGTVYNVHNQSGTEVIPGGSRDGCDSTIIVDLFFYGTVDIDVIEPSCDGLMQTEVEILESGNAVLPIDVYYNGAYYEMVNFLPHRLTFPADGAYSLRIVDDEGCSYTQDIHVTSRETISAYITGDSIAIKGDTVALSAIISGTYESIRWTPSNMVSCDTCLSTTAEINKTTLVVLEIVDKFGCITEVTKVVVVSEGYSIYIPNAFTPNIDGLNDNFIIQMGPNVPGMKRMEIFDRWGNRVYDEFYASPTKTMIGWNGKFRSQILNPDVFIYKIEVEVKPGQFQIFKGTLTLLR